MEIGIFGNLLPIARADGVEDGEWGVVAPRLAALSGLDHWLQHPDILVLRPTFSLIRRITVFRSVRFGPHLMTRSFVDTAEGHFYWHVSDLADPGYSTPERVLSYLLHDAHHVRQRLDGDTGQHIDQQVQREVDATDVQLVFARIASAADSKFLEFLEGYRNDPDKIKGRLATGVGFFESMFFGKQRFEDHLTIF